MSDTAHALSSSHQPSYKSKGGDPQKPRSRPSKRSKPDQIFDISYYQSLAPSTPRAVSPSSSEYSCDSESGSHSRKGVPAKALKQVRRSSALSDIGLDRRRLAIVEMETCNEGRIKSASEHGHGSAASHSRRAAVPNLTGLALVAPPDASPLSYTQLSPPIIAPASVEQRFIPAKEDGRHLASMFGISTPQRPSTPDSSSVHAEHRSQTPKTADQSSLRPSSRQSQSHIKPAYLPPVQPLNLRSSASSSSVNLHSPSFDQPILTPPLGQSKDVTVPVAAPVIVALESSKAVNATKSKNARSDSPAPQIIVQSASGSSTSNHDAPSYLHYQPGFHATAGPLPPPPRATFAIDPTAPPPPRPPRVYSPHPPRNRGDIEAVKQALQLLPSVSRVMTSVSPETEQSTTCSLQASPASSADTDSTKLPLETPTLPDEIPEPLDAKPAHRREGAFIPTPDPSMSSETEHIISFPLPPEPGQEEIAINVDNASDQKELQDANRDTLNHRAEKIQVISPPPRVDSLTSRIPLDRDSTRANVTQHLTPSPETNILDGLSALASLPEHSPPPSQEDTIQIPSPPPKSFRNSLTTNLKRFSSLPRTPSHSSRSGKRSSAETRHSSRTPSPSHQQQSDPMGPSQRHKIISRSPPAMFCHEVHSCRTALERCTVYAQKINELYGYDTGLGDWLNDAKYRGSNPNPSHIPSSPPTDPFTPQRRHTSGSSMMTEATFPRRPDATTATDLSGSYRNITPPTAHPPPLPYPSLAVATQQRPPRTSSNAGSNTPTSSIRSLAPPTSTASVKGGFFASLGRRGSVSGRREKSGITSLSPAGSQSSNNGSSKPPAAAQQQQVPSRPVNVTANPSVPGGPRAPPNRAKRSQTLMATPSSFSSKPQAERNEQLLRRPSAHNVSLNHVTDVRADPEFTRQVDKLADLLPHADRNILAGYLRRAGQDILAIGQYLEDERNGTLRTD
ncbi:hypothetical protein AX17_001207 [Amanita inopinata Kibby_2008]|nr:hypothetical protein AX17_001207 [Amanita inopinata Kibby_2008]